MNFIIKEELQNKLRTANENIIELEQQLEKMKDENNELEKKYNTLLLNGGIEDITEIENEEGPDASKH